MRDATLKKSLFKRGIWSEGAATAPPRGRATEMQRFRRPEDHPTWTLLLRAHVVLILVLLSRLPGDIPVLILLVRTVHDRMNCPLLWVRHSCNPLTFHDPTLAPPTQLPAVNHSYQDCDVIARCRSRSVSVPFKSFFLHFQTLDLLLKHF